MAIYHVETERKVGFLRREVLTLLTENGEVKSIEIDGQKRPVFGIGEEDPKKRVPAEALVDCKGKRIFYSSQPETSRHTMISLKTEPIRKIKKVKN